MTAIEAIKRVIESKVLKKSLTYLPGRGATVQELAELSDKLPRPLSTRHLALLKHWNGINLDVVRLYGASPTFGELRGLSETQSGPLTKVPGAIVFGDDPSGFIYAEASNGEILSFDSSFGEIKAIASNLDDFFTRLVFGKDAAEFAGDEWMNNLRMGGFNGEQQ